MSIQTEIDRIKTGIASAYAALAEKGITSTGGVDELGELIRSIRVNNYDFSGYLNFSKINSGTIVIPSEVTHFTVRHGLGMKPKLFLFMKEYDESITTNYRGIGAFCTIMPSENAYYSVTLRMNGSKSVSSNETFTTTMPEGRDVFSTTADRTDLWMGKKPNIPDYYKILAGSVFHWIAAA